MHNITIHSTDWHTDKNRLSLIRRRVFIEEQNVPEELEWDDLDATSVHFLVTNNDKAIACARLTVAGRIGRMAVLAEYRGHGIGSQLLQAVLQKTHELKLNNIHLHAQVSAIAFYEKQGFSTKGDVFFEATIPHQEMFKKIC